jgi:hypothetical protein
MQKPLLAIVLALILAAAGLSLSQVSYPMQIVNPKTLDESGNPKTTFKRGALVLVEATVNCPFAFYAPPEYRFLYIVKFKDSNDVTFYYGVVYGKLSPGQNATFAVGGKIPDNAPEGNYTAWIYVWSNWPAYGNVTAYAEAVSITFTVTKS